MNDGLYITWGDHQWFQRKARQLELVSGESVFQRRCMRCARDFVIDALSGARHAVAVSTFSFHPLQDKITQRWLAEPCPGLRLPGDDDDRELQVAELRVLTEVRHIEVTAAPVILSSPAAFKTRSRPRNRSRIGLVPQRGNVARPGTKRLNTTPALGDPV